MRHFFFKVPEMESTLVIISAHGWDLRENIPKMLPTASSHLLWQVQLSPMGWGAPSVWSGEGNGTPLQYSCLDNPMDGGAWWAAVHGSRRVRHDCVTSLSLFAFMHWRRKWQPTPLFLLGESRGWRSLVGCRLWDRTESDTTEAT